MSATMDKPQDSADGRPFQPVSVGTCHAQTANDRFGSGASRAVLRRERPLHHFLSPGDPAAFDWPGSDSDSGEDFPDPDTYIYRLVPTMQRYRNNLTALSQLYNLYFVAYQGLIFTYVPRNVPKQSIPRHPDFRIAPPASEASRSIGGYLDPTKPHSINHLTVGALGTEEVVVASFDDGDVVAYSTREIADWILSRCDVPSSVPPVQKTTLRGRGVGRMPRPLLHENVGKSAWGLAVHQKSRLVAVSSKRCEVTVFAFALTAGGDETGEADTCQRCQSSGQCQDNERHVRRRARNWRIVVEFGEQADNMPNICFVDDDDGGADMICAVDIRGAMWLAEIWRPSQAPMRVEAFKDPSFRSFRTWSTQSRGWGILALARDSFLEVESVEELLGASARDAELLPNSALSVERTVDSIPDNPSLPGKLPSLPSGPDGDVDAQAVTGPFVNQALNAVLGISLAPEDSNLSDSWSDGSLDMIDEPGTEGGAEQGQGLGGALELGEDEDGDGADDEYMATLESSVASGEITQPIPLHLLLAQVPLNAGDFSLHVPGAGVGGLLATGNAGWGNLPAAVVGPAQGGGGGGGGGGGDGCQAAKGWGSDQGGQASAGVRVDMGYLPHKNYVFPMPRDGRGLVEFLRRPKNKGKATDGVGLGDRFAKRHHVLRMYEKEVELRSLEREGPGGRPELGMVCPQAMNLGAMAATSGTKVMFNATERLSMAAHVPELSLVVVASAIGRVLLVTPTRLAAPVKRGRGVVQHGFRIDWVLPRLSDERRLRTQPRPLHGMAVGPVQESGGGGGGGGEAPRALAPRRFRLMLHYQNHDILTYEITREGETGKVCIF